MKNATTRPVIQVFDSSLNSDALNQISMIRLGGGRFCSGLGVLIGTPCVPFKQLFINPTWQLFYSRNQELIHSLRGNSAIVCFGGVYQLKSFMDKESKKNTESNGIMATLRCFVSLLPKLFQAISIVRKLSAEMADFWSLP